MKAELLHVVTAISNPVRWESRLRLYKQFEEHMLDSGVKLTVVECAYGDRPFECDSNPHVNHIGVRAKTLVWNKECLLNIGFTRQPEDCKYLAWIDADIEFRRKTWASDTVHALQQYDVIQPWSDCYELGPQGQHVEHHLSFCRQWWHDCQIGPAYRNAHCGYAWAITRRALGWVGLLIETAPLGAADHHMALALIGKVDTFIPGNLTDPYMRHLHRWQERALRHINKNIGFTHGSTIEHHFHGRKVDRRYWDRWKILVRHGFNPDTDLKRNVYGVIELAGNKPALAHDIDRYFRMRSEDANTLD